MSKKILILGGSRFHGCQMAEHFLQTGHEVHVLNRGRYRERFAPGIRHLLADRNDVETARNVLQDNCYDVVIDNNAYTRSQVNIILDILNGRYGHYVFTSTAAVYLKLSSGRKLQEEDANGAVCGLYTPGVKEYALNKFAAERAILAKAQDSNYTILRFPNIYGEGDFAGKLTYYYFRLKDGKLLLLEEEIERFSLIYVKDVVSVFEAVAGNSSCFGKIINVADPVDYDYNEFFSFVYRELFSYGKLLLMPARKMWEGGYFTSFPWSPVLDLSVAGNLLCNIEYTRINKWCGTALKWELEHFGNRQSDPDFAAKRELELRLIDKAYEGQ